eukprot:285103-Prymnesium_polylepis.1
MRPPGPANTWRSLRGCLYSHASDEAAPDVLPSTGGGGKGESGRLRAALEEGEMVVVPPQMKMKLCGRL